MANQRGCTYVVFVVLRAWSTLFLGLTQKAVQAHFSPRISSCKLYHSREVRVVWDPLRTTDASGRYPMRFPACLSATRKGPRLLFVFSRRSSLRVA